MLPAEKPEKISRYSCFCASYSAWNFDACAPFWPGTGDIGRSKDSFFISVAFEIRSSTGRRTLLAPAVSVITEELYHAIEVADDIFFDGTFWSNDELAHNGGSSRTALEMGHLPIGGPGGSLERLGALKGVRRVYTHLNNTNPVLDPFSRERACVAREGIEVGTDGTVIEP